MTKWIENNIGKCLFIFGVIFVFEAGLIVWRLPNEFRANVIPKLNTQIYKYDALVNEFKEDFIRVNSRMDGIKEYLILITNENHQRINLLSEIRAREALHFKYHFRPEEIDSPPQP